MPRRGEGIPQDFEAYKEAAGGAIGARIRMRRTQLKMSQESVRAQMELENVYLSRAQLSRIEVGTSLPNAVEIIALVRVLQITCSWLLFGDAE